MGSTTLASFLSRLLKPDRKEKSSATAKGDLRKRHSAPVPSWFDVNDPTHIPPPASNTAAQSKPRRKQKEGKLEERRLEQDQRSSKQTSKHTVNVKNSNKNKNTNNKQKNKSKQGSKTSPIENSATDVEETNKENRKRNKAARRHSTGLSYWFCVSGHADTLERGLNAPYPRADHKSRRDDHASKSRGNRQDLASIPEQGQIKSSSKPDSLAGVIRRDGKKRKGDAKNRHSAPPDTLAVIRPKERPLTPNQLHGVIVQQQDSAPIATPERLRCDAAPSPTRSMSPGVRYRVDGTLERPYVFPSGLTFGAEGRKVQLRSSSVSPLLELPGQSGGFGDANTSTVAADVHETPHDSGRNGKHGEKRYFRSSNPNVADVSYDDFDVRKAFYLKFDNENIESQCPAVSNGKHFRHSVPVFPESFDTFAHNAYTSTDRSSHQRSDNAIPEEGTQQSTRRQQRYSMPPKNEEFVYMGSRDNLNVWIDFMAVQETVDQNANATAAAETEPRKRYSSPVQNTDCVYMGSIENIHLLNSEDKRAGVLSLKRDVDAFFLTGSGAMPVQAVDDGATTRFGRDPGVQATSLFDHESNGDVDTVPHDISAQSDGIRNPYVHSPPIIDEVRNPEEHRHSLPELSLPRGLSLRKEAVSESNAVESDVIISDGEDCLTENDALDKGVRSRVRRDPFSRNLGRASCMPGNKRSFAPPPAVFSQSDSTVQLAGTKEAPRKHLAATERLSFMPGNKRFNLPPPPNYTPPREEMEDAHARLAEMAARNDKGSQTNLQDEALYSVDMEDRDLSLSRNQAKTIRSSLSSSEPPLPQVQAAMFSFQGVDMQKGFDFTQTKPQRADAEDSSRHPKDQVKARRLLNISTTSSQGSDDVFKDGLASDTTWQVNRFKPSRTGKYSLPGVRPRIDTYALPKADETNEPMTKTSPSPKFQDTRNTLISKDSSSSHEKDRTITVTKTDDKHGDYVVKSDSSFAPFEAADAVVTSTPKIVRRDRSTANVDTTEKEGTVCKPVPTPRKRYSALGLAGYSSFSMPGDIHIEGFQQHQRILSTPDTSAAPHNKERQTEISPERTASPHIKVPPIPKKRRNFSKSTAGSDSCYSSPEDSNKKPTPSPVTESTTQSSMTESQHDNSKQHAHEPSKRNITKANSTSDILSESGSEPKPHYHHHPHQQQHHHHHTITSTTGSKSSRHRHNRGVSFDDTCIADDEMSCFDDDEWSNNPSESTLKRRRRSIRKCVSVDDLLRSGSILDRSLILARKRRRRMRDRKCQSQLLLSSSEEEEGTNGLTTRDRQSWKTNGVTNHLTLNGSVKLKALASFDKAVPSSTARQNSFGHHSNGPLEARVPSTRDHNETDKSGTKQRPDSRVQKPWEIGLQNMPLKHHITNPLKKGEASSVPSPLNTNKQQHRPRDRGLQNMVLGGTSSTPVPRWRAVITASTSELEKGIKTGIETVV